MDRYLCFATLEEREAWKVNCEIEKELKKSKKDQRKEIKLLLLGAGESGKSTFIKQMRIIHGRGYSDEDKQGMINLIYLNIFQSMQNMIEAMKKLDLEYCEEQNKTFSLQIEKAKNIDNHPLFASYVPKLKSLWEDEGIQECFKRSNEYQLSDSTKYYMVDLVRIGEEKYLPTEQDILRVRLPTTGVHEYHFDLNDALFRMVDVGGQRSERRKWINCFDNITSIMYLVALSEYDLVLHEDPTQNRLAESRALFHTIMSYECFQALASVVLFLNKTDIFNDKIEFSNLAKYFPDFEGNPGDNHAARDYIYQMFSDVMEENKEKKEGEAEASGSKLQTTGLYMHYTCATDTHNIKVVFEAVQHTILRDNLKSYALISSGP